MTKNHRCCISCRRVADRLEFIRVVRVHPHHDVAIDPQEANIQGRSAYLCRSNQCIQIAQKKNRLSRTLKTFVPASIYSQIAIDD